MAANTATVTSSDGSTVTVLVEPAPINPEHVADMALLWALFLTAAVPIFCIRYLTGLFRTDQSE